MAAPDFYNPPLSTYPSPLTGYEGLPPLSDDKNEDGKSLKNTEAERSPAYDAFVDPLDRGQRGGFDIHIYYFQANPEQTAYARALHERIRREFPELRIYRFWDRPIGPHPVAMFEVNLFTPAQFGAFIPWLAVWRGPLSALVHPNTTDGGGDADPVLEIAVERRNHSQRAMWLGERLPLDFSIFDKMAQNAAAAAASGTTGVSGDDQKAAIVDSISG
ncbi:hypothetical protein SBRCBS47491_001310 [Sporothrix bragantina]|uniref:DOPA 4,5-dioxygenase n=1 Tax=Sporothrix bragantina TaxID=671064 RepID=A0ABP0AXK1_9PEZI